MSKPKRQHWVSQFYLKYFATPETRRTKIPMVNVHQRDKLNEHASRRAVKEICVQGHLYSPVQNNGERDWSMEEMLGDTEAKLGSMWPEITQGDTAVPNNDAKRFLAMFVAAMHLRNPAIHKLIESTFALADQLLGRVGSRNLDKPEKVHPDAGNPDRYFVSMIRDRLADITKTFYAKRWMIGTRDSDSFITSDLPVVFLNPNNPKKAGPGTPNTTTFFPLSPRRILMMDDRVTKLNNVQFPLDDEAVKAINRLLLTGSKRFVFAGHEPVLGLAPDERQPDVAREA